MFVDFNGKRRKPLINALALSLSVIKFYCSQHRFED